MATKLHSALTDLDGIHEPKGISTASAGTVYVATGNGTGQYKKPEELGYAKADGLTLNTAIKQAISIPLANALTDADLIAMFKNNSTSMGVYVIAFPYDVTHSAYLNFKLPNNYVDGTDIIFNLNWCPENSDSGNIVFGIEYDINNISSSMTNTIISTTTVTSPAVSKKLQSTNLITLHSGTDVDGNVLKKGTVINVRLYRDTANTSDTYNSKVYCFFLNLIYDAKTLGDTTFLQ